MGNDCKYRWAVTVLGGLACLAFSDVQAQQTIYNVPSADVTEKNQVFLEHESQFRAWAPGRYWYGTHYFSYGAGHYTELDASLYNLSSPASGNLTLGAGFKTTLPLLPKKFPRREIKLTGGTQVLVSLQGKGVGNWSYGHLSVRVPRLNTRLTAGVSAGTSHLFGRSSVHFIGGLEQPVTKRITLLADWYSGKHSIGFLTSGFSVAMPRQTTLFVGYQVPNNRKVAGGQGFTIEVAKFF